MVNLTFPATTAYLNALTRAQHTREVLRIVEALRKYASENGDRFPEKLEEIQSVPVPPIDPYSGKPFDYKLRDGIAVIESDSGNAMIRFVVKVRQGDTPQ